MSSSAIVRADFSCDQALSVNGGATAPIVQWFMANASMLTNAVFYINICAAQKFTLASVNNTNPVQTAQNVNVQLYDYNNNLLGGNNTTFATNLGVLEKDQQYYLKITTAAGTAIVQGPTVYLFELRAGVLAEMDQFFADGLQDFPLIDGVVRTNQNYGAKTFTFTNVTVTAGQQVALCFADVALQAGTFAVTVTGNCIGVFVPYQQAFVANNSVAIIMTALADATIATGTVGVTLTAITGTTVQCNFALVKSSGKFTAPPVTSA